MKVRWRKEHLDVILVPSSLLIMFGYHLFLLYRCQRRAGSTVIGYENHNKKAWVERILKIEAKDRGAAVSVISGNISAATNLSSICLALCALIGAWLGTNSKNIFTSTLIYGNTSQSILSLKYISLLSCLMVAFAAFVQCIRCFVHANFLISMPNADVPLSFMENAVIHGSNFWVVGMRALYLGITFMLWIFGPIPMFVSSVLMVALLHTLDRNNKPLHHYRSQPSTSSSNLLIKNVGCQENVSVNRVNGNQAIAQGNAIGTPPLLFMDAFISGL